MRIAFDSRPASNSRGIGRYVRSLLPELHALGRGAVREDHRPRSQRVDVYHSPWIDGAMLRCPVPMVVTLHDLVPLKRRGEYLRTGLRFHMRYLAVRRAERVIVPTEAVAHDAHELLAIDRERIAVIPEAVAPVLRARPADEVAAARERHGLPDDYLLWVGGLEHADPRKRVAALAAAPRSLPLVLVGRSSGWASELPGVIVTGEVDDDNLAAIYTGARALVFPSDDEGFGLPPLEALECGTPVAACDVPAVREVVGDRATLVPNGDMDALVRAAEDARRPVAASDGRGWSWRDAARATWDLYEETATCSGPAVPR